MNALRWKRVIDDYRNGVASVEFLLSKGFTFRKLSVLTGLDKVFLCAVCVFVNEDIEDVVKDIVACFSDKDRLEFTRHKSILQLMKTRGLTFQEEIEALEYAINNKNDEEIAQFTEESFDNWIKRVDVRAEEEFAESIRKVQKAEDEMNAVAALQGRVWKIVRENP